MQHTSVSTVTISSPMGPIRITSNAEGIREIAFVKSARSSSPTDPVASEASSQLSQYISGTRTSFDLTLAATGTPFQRAVWKALLAVPFGSTCTYGDIARAIGKPKAVRAVGQAVGANPIAIVVPCHRILPAHGKGIGNYASGVPRKKWLLARESDR